MKTKRIKAEPFDIMQYFYGAVHEPLIHALIRLSGRTDEAALKAAVTLSMNAVPILRCCFNTAGRRPFWDIRGFTGEDVVHVVETDPADSGQAEKLLTSTMDLEREPQLRIYILRLNDFDTLCIICSHLVCDGAGFKEYLYLLSKLYTAYVNGEAAPSLCAGPRGTGQLFAGFSAIQKLRIAFQKYDLSALKQQATYRLQGDAGNPFFVTRDIEKVDVAGIKEAARSYGATINDMLLAAYIRVLSRKTGERRIVMPCPADLRKYLPSHNDHGICNLTTNYLCDICVAEGDSFERTVKQVSEQMRKQKESTACLKSVMMLEAVFCFMTFHALKRTFHKLFTIPVLSYTNLGVIDKEGLCFGAPVTDMHLTGAIKYAPYFQLAVSTSGGVMTLSCNMYGTRDARDTIEDFLKDVHCELLAGSLS